ncbi:MAG: hypothetical protein Q9159_005377 [Coniocarpon cinnabarinum]
MARHHWYNQPPTTLLASLVAFLSYTCAVCALSSGTYDTAFSGVTWDNDNWVLENTVPDRGHYQSRGNLANGYIGINIASTGPFFDVDDPTDDVSVNGWPLFDARQSFATVGGFYDVQPTTNMTNFEWLNELGGESVISGLPHWAGLLLEVNGNVLDATIDLQQISDFRSRLDMKNGIMTWHYTWTPPGSCAMDVSYAMFLHKLYVNQAAVQLNVTAAEDATVGIVDALHGDCAVRSSLVDKQYINSMNTIWSAVSPNNIPYATAFVYSTMQVNDMIEGSRMEVNQSRYIGTNSSGIAQQVAVDLKAGEPVMAEKYVGVASTDAFADPQQVAMGASIKGSQAGFQNMLSSHAKEWHSLLTPDSVDSFADPQTGALSSEPNIVHEQIIAVVNPFFLLQNLVSNSTSKALGSNENLTVNSIPVSGLSSSSYAGLIFWDTEVWMSPGLTVSFPEQVRQISNYRVHTYPTARNNVQEKYTSSQNDTYFSPNAAIYPWTSGRFGNCTGTGPCFDYEYHINGDIILQLENYYIVSGDQQSFRNLYYPIYSSVAQTESNLLHYNEDTGTYFLRNATDPDEYANMIDNPAYTMALISNTLNNANLYARLLGLPENETWAYQANRVAIPTDPGAHIISEYQGMNGSIAVKQADVVLIDDLLDRQNEYTLDDFDFYAGHQDPNGPGMTYGVFSIVSSNFAPSGCAAFSYDLYSSQPYARAPWFQFSEQLVDDYDTNGGTNPAFPFLTGMGGAYRVNVFGYLGLRLRIESLNVNPSLPPQIPNLKYRTTYWQGHAVKAVANQTHTTLNRAPELSIETRTPEHENGIPVTIAFDRKTIYNLTTSQPLVLKNRPTSANLTEPGNILQCAPAVSSNTSYAPGQFPLSAIDGGHSTSWRPSNPNITSSLTIDLGAHSARFPISALKFDWAQNPPVSYSVVFSNASASPLDAGSVEVHRDETVAVSSPYDAETVDRVVPYRGNTTDVMLNPQMWSGRYVTLVVSGNQNTLGDGRGASVSEFSVIAAERHDEENVSADREDASEGNDLEEAVNRRPRKQKLLG